MYYYSLGTWRGPVLSMKPMGGLQPSYKTIIIIIAIIIIIII